MGRLTGALVLAIVEAAMSAPRDVLFDDGWKFYRGDVPPSPPPPCPSDAFPEQIGRCMGLTRIREVKTVKDCPAACCGSINCTTWQWMGAEGGEMADSCWIGDFHRLSCTNDTEGWITGARNTAPPTRMPVPQFAQTTYDDSGWRSLDLPHDWAIEDLPDRENDKSVPAITIRNGSWFFAKGDNPAWSDPAYNTSNWMTVAVPHDWRDPPISYQDVNAVGWYRRNFTLSTSTLQLFKDAPTSPVLALGTVACTDTTFVNGVKVGSTSGCITFRSYPLDPSLLRVGENNVAVQVKTPGGKANVPMPTASPGGICDSGATAVNGVSVAGGADWTPPSAFDAARSLSTGANGRSVGYSTAGHGWYRKTFSTSFNDDERIFIRFDGSYMNTDLWCNGKHVTTHPYGYTTWEVDLTPFLHTDRSSNVLAVRVLTLGANSRWYSGSGLFRHVWITTTPSLRISLWGVSVATSSVSENQAITRIAVKVTNSDPVASSPSGEVSVTIRDANGSVAGASSFMAPAIPPNSSTRLQLERVVVKGTSDAGGIYLWDLDSPMLYTAEVSISQSKDSVVVSFGIRTINFTADNGFLLNGKPTILKGGCVHHDNGILGSAAIDRAEERRVENLKANGYNAIRTSHNPVSPAFLDACDKLGMLVMDEAFDCWEWGKNHDDYHVDFDAWWQRDLTSMVMRDINHPSVIMWSIGNEIPMRESAAGYALVKQLADFVRSLDQSGRPVTSAVPMVKDKDEPYLEALDVGGYNYSPNRYESDHHDFPTRVMVGTESFPTRSFEMWSHYTSEPWVIGDFIWTAIDYIGESAIGNAATSPDIQYFDGQPWEWHISFCGDIDIVGMQKPQAFYRRVLWDVSDIEILVHKPITSGQQEHISGWGWPDERDSWNWPEGTNTTVRVFSKCSKESVPTENITGSVTLLLNGNQVPGSPAEIGPSTQFIAEFTVPYHPGTLEARCTNLENPPRATLSSTGFPSAIQAHPDRTEICASRNDLAYVTVEVVDNDGARVPDARELLTFNVTGVGELAAVGTGDPTDVSSFFQGTKVSWQGRAVAILRPGPMGKVSTGKITLSVSGEGLASTSVDVTVIECS